ncbi:MAG: hypothetical protein M3139_05990 [Bacteroidota bacterium]|nr:hypothetical protein [Bacteroidota bacterium]
MKKTILLSAIIFLAITGISAQSYSTAVGAKFYAGNGSVGGINVRHILTPNTAVEGSLLFYSGGLGVEGLYQYQGPITSVEGLQYFAGGGAMLGFGTGRNSETLFALRLTGGLDYKFADAPIDISLGLDPFFNIAPSSGSTLALGIGLRYVIR